MAHYTNTNTSIHHNFLEAGKFFFSQLTFSVQTPVCFALRMHDQRMGSIQTEAGIHSVSLVSDMH